MLIDALELLKTALSGRQEVLGSWVMSLNGPFSVPDEIDAGIFEYFLGEPDVGV